jgi:hypothetical protein
MGVTIKYASFIVPILYLNYCNMHQYVPVILRMKLAQTYHPYFQCGNQRIKTK